MALTAKEWLLSEMVAIQRGNTRNPLTGENKKQAIEELVRLCDQRETVIYEENQ